MISGVFKHLISAAGRKPGMIAISIMPPPIPVTAVIAEVIAAIRISRMSLLKGKHAALRGARGQVENRVR